MTLLLLTAWSTFTFMHLSNLFWKVNYTAIKICFFSVSAFSESWTNDLDVTNYSTWAVPFLVLLFCSVRLPCVAEVRSTFKVFRHEAGFTVIFFLLWFPYSVVIFLYALQDLHVFLACTTNIHFDFAIHVTECIAFMHVFANPVLYISLNKKVWRRLRNACKTPREYLLEESNSSSVMLSQRGAIELKAVQQYQVHDLSISAERPNNFLPELL